MFGMLDYRAHKLLWLVCLPIRVAERLSWFANIAVSVWIVQSDSVPGTPLLGKIVLGILFFWGIWLGIEIVWGVVFWLVHKGFFWFIDVIPADGDSAQEARQVVLRGKTVRLTKKLMAHINDWTSEDTRDLVSAAFNWRARLVFNLRAT
jgi:hypothetical protein